MKGNMMGATGRFTIATAMHTALPRGSDTNHLTFGLKTPGRRACYRSLRLSDRHEAEFRLVPGGMAPIALGSFCAKDTALADPDFAEALQARIRADLEAEAVAQAARHRPDPNERRTIAALGGQIAALGEAG